MPPSPPLPPVRSSAAVQADISAWLDLPVTLRARLDPDRRVLAGLQREWVAAERAQRAGCRVCGLAA